MRLALLALLLPLTGCSLYPSPDVPVACTMDFRSESVRVVSAAEVPVLDASVDVVRVSSGRSIFCTAEAQTGCLHRPSWSMSGQDSYHVVMDDGVPLSRSGEDFRVTATKGASSASAVLRFADDGCHMEKRSGPDVLRLAP